MKTMKPIVPPRLIFPTIAWPSVSMPSDCGEVSASTRITSRAPAPAAKHARRETAGERSADVAQRAARGLGRLSAPRDDDDAAEQDERRAERDHEPISRTVNRSASTRAHEGKTPRSGQRAASSDDRDRRRAVVAERDVRVHVAGGSRDRAVQPQPRAAVAVVDDLDLAQVDGGQQRRPPAPRARPGLHERLLGREARGQPARVALRRALLERGERAVDEPARGVAQLLGEARARRPGRRRSRAVDERDSASASRSGRGRAVAADGAAGRPMRASRRRGRPRRGGGRRGAGSPRGRPRGRRRGTCRGARRRAAPRRGRSRAR